MKLFSALDTNQFSTLDRGLKRTRCLLWFVVWIIVSTAITGNTAANQAERALVLYHFNLDSQPSQPYAVLNIFKLKDSTEPLSMIAGIKFYFSNGKPHIGDYQKKDVPKFIQTMIDRNHLESSKIKNIQQKIGAYPDGDWSESTWIALIDSIRNDSSMNSDIVRRFCDKRYRIIHIKQNLLNTKEVAQIGESVKDGFAGSKEIPIPIVKRALDGWPKPESQNKSSLEDKRLDEQSEQKLSDETSDDAPLEDKGKKEVSPPTPNLTTTPDKAADSDQQKDKPNNASDQSEDERPTPGNILWYVFVIIAIIALFILVKVIIQSYFKKTPQNKRHSNGMNTKHQTDERPHIKYAQSEEISMERLSQRLHEIHTQFQADDRQFLNDKTDELKQFAEEIMDHTGKEIRKNVAIRDFIVNLRQELASSLNKLGSQVEEIKRRNEKIARDLYVGSRSEKETVLDVIMKRINEHDKILTDMSKKIDRLCSEYSGAKAMPNQNLVSMSHSSKNSGKPKDKQSGKITDSSGSGYVLSDDY